MAALLIQLGISRQREYAADAAGVRMVGHPYGLISALEKLGAYNKKIPMDVSPATASLFIVAPLSAGQVFTGPFSTHPPLDDRIRTLRSMTVSRQLCSRTETKAVEHFSFAAAQSAVNWPSRGNWGYWDSQFELEPLSRCEVG